MFKDKAQAGDRSVLDAVLSDAKDLLRNISWLDQQKLDEYLAFSRIEKRIEARQTRRVTGLAADFGQAKHTAPERWLSAGHR